MGKGKRAEDAEELDLVPIMNLVTILIPFLLMASSYVSLAVIDSTLPAIGDPSEKTDEKPEETLDLSVIITDQGYTIAGKDAKLKGDGESKGATLSCRRSGCPDAESYKTEDLTRMLGEIKDRWPKETNVILVPESQIQYEVLIRTMDATREDPNTKVDGNPRELFPFVVIAGGVQ